jgi:hypothetical protein
VADVLQLDCWLPDRPDAQFAAESLVVNRPVAENAGQNFVRENLRRFVLHGWQRNRRWLGQCSRMSFDQASFFLSALS